MNPHDLYPRPDQEKIAPAPIADFLNSQDVRKSFGIDPEATFQLNNPKIEETLIAERYKNTIKDIDFILNSGKDIKVVFYSGMGNGIEPSQANHEALKRHSKWNEIEQFSKAFPKNWIDDEGIVIGTYKALENLGIFEFGSAGRDPIRRQ
mmetsp:Transcript_12378/g.10669  ORF Transcript_12378/g.10669 Transcript_12378/m.10669 type:complete len:150 (-) Transcript_12378:19-468(-)